MPRIRIYRLQTTSPRCIQLPLDLCCKGIQTAVLLGGRGVDVGKWTLQTLCIIMLHCYILLCKFACELVQGLTWTLDRCLVFGESLRHLETRFGNEMKRGALKRTWTFRDLWCLWRLGDMMRDEILESVQLSSSTSGTSGTPELWKKPGNAKSVGSSSFHGTTSALPPRESKRIQGHFQGKTKKCNIDRSK